MKKIIERLRKKGLKPTSQRIAVLQNLTGRRDHPTAGDIYNDVAKKHPTISKATVYSTLKLLSEYGEVQELSIRKMGEACFDPVLELHHHFLCRECGRIIDVYTECRDECVIIKAGEAGGNVVEEVQAYMYGLCSDCVKKNNYLKKM
ncbi:transcriptional repressor [bacterium]|nr:transcriptional repressor [bacterium]